VKTFEIEVTRRVQVTLDESKFDEKFMREFDRWFYDFGRDINRHVKHLAWLYAAGRIGGLDRFVEGYGKLSEMGISFDEINGDDVEITAPKGPLSRLNS